MTTPKPQSNQAAAAELLLKRGAGDGPATPSAWGSFPTKQELRAALPPLAASVRPVSDDAPGPSLAHNPVATADQRGAFGESGAAGKSRINRSGHKP